MFSSPAIRIFNAENAENMVQRKPGSNVPTRKPFLDRTVNSRTPEKKSNSPFQKVQLVISNDKGHFKEDLSCGDFIYSRKQTEDYEDNWLETKLIENAERSFRKWCGKDYESPPPSPEMEVPEFFTSLPESLPTSPLFFSQPLKGKVDCQVEIPHIDFDLDDLDTSI